MEDTIRARVDPKWCNTHTHTHTQTNRKQRGRKKKQTRNNKRLSAGIRREQRLDAEVVGLAAAADGGGRFQQLGREMAHRIGRRNLSDRGKKKSDRRDTIKKKKPKEFVEEIDFTGPLRGPMAVSFLFY